MTEDVKCPICGSETVIRTAVKGPDTGLRFHVCVRFPKCKGRISVEEDSELSDLFDMKEAREKRILMRNYNSAKSISTILKVLAVIILVLGVAGTIALAVDVSNDYGSTTSDIIILLLTTGLVVIVYSVLLFAAAYVIDILIDIARNTGDTSNLLAKRFKRD